MYPTNRFINILENSLIGIHGFILILLIGQAQITLPSILSVFGRMHPLLLHFPIVLLLLGILLVLFPKILSGAQHQQQIKKIILLVALVFTGFTIISGLFLSTEPGYTREDIQYHQWTGLLVFWLGTALYWGIHKNLNYLNNALAGGLFICIFITGHLGASLTHGEDFLWSPLATNEIENISLDQALAYDHVIKPILEQKCVSCHKASKQKGELRLDKPEFILAGGENGEILNFKDPENSMLLHRITLPLDHDDHMPPKGKNQLTDEEIDLLQAWVKDSVSFERKLVHYDQKSEFFQLAHNKFQEQQKVYDFPAADLKVVQSLNNFYRRVIPVYPQSPALQVSFFSKENFNPATLKELNKIQEQLVELNLSNMPLSDDDLKIISSFQNLEKLNLNFTGISGENLNLLKDLKHLKSLSLTGNSLNASSVPVLTSMDHLESVFLWNTGLSDKDLKQIKSQLSKTLVETGYKDDGTLYELNAPKIEYEQLIFRDSIAVKLKHPISNVKLYYTLDNSLPDSSNHLIYENQVVVTKSSTLRVRAFAEGWLGSKEAKAVFLKAGTKPDQYVLKFDPDPKYKGKGAEILFDLEKGDKDFGSGKWLGFKENPFEINLKFDKPRDIQNIAFSLFTDEASFIFPPSQIDLWVKVQNSPWKKTLRDSPIQPTKANGKAMMLKKFPMNENQISEIRIRLLPIHSLPKWHPGAGQKGWVFIDEILID